MVVWLVSILILYFYLHNPIFTLTGGVGAIKLLYPLAFLYWLTKNVACSKAVYHFRGVLKYLVLILFFVIFRYVIGGDSSPIYFNVIMLLEVYFLPITIVVFLKNNNFQSKDFITLLLVISAIASVITAACVAIPSFGSYVRHSLLLFNQNDYLMENLYRGFGISDSLTSSYGFIQGVMLALGIFYLKDNKWFLLFIPFMLFSILLNARTGIILAVIGILLTFICKKQFKYMLITLGVTFIVISLIPFFISSLGLSDDSLLFITGFFDEVISVFESKDISSSNTTSALFDSMIVWPDDLFQWILGRGFSLFRADFHVNSDVGYINQLNYGGLVYVFILLSFFFYLIKQMKYRHVDRFIIYMFIFSALILNVKCDFFCNIGIFRLFLLMFYFNVLNDKSQTHNVKRIEL